VEFPSFGDLILTPESIGDLGVYLGEDDDAYHVLRCNNDGDVVMDKFSRALFWTARRPSYETVPVTVRQIRVGTRGALKNGEASKEK
jgi:hypothetical protein